jgi:hypothetical protein
MIFKNDGGEGYLNKNEHLNSVRFYLNPISFCGGEDNRPHQL